VAGALKQPEMGRVLSGCPKALIKTLALLQALRINFQLVC
jgi:hypothetical protein